MIDSKWRQRIVRLSDGVYLMTPEGETTTERARARVFRSVHAANCALEYHQHRSRQKYPRALILRPNKGLTM